MPKEINTGTLASDIEIDDTDLGGEMARQPSRYFYWGSAWSRATAFAKKMKVALKETEARLANAFRVEMTQQKPGTRVTDSLIQDYLHTHEEWKVAEEAVRRAEYNADLLDVAREALKQRHHSLQSLFKQNDESRLYGTEYQQVEAIRNVFEEREARRKKNDKEV
jgi:hypothetical protein